MIPGVERDRLLEMWQKMVLIRRFEEALIGLEGHVPTNIHVYIGQEATAVAACEALGRMDTIVTTHRNHGHVIARGGEPEPIMAECLGKATGYCKGKGGSYHVSAPELGVIAASAIVAGSIPIAVGAALSAHMQSLHRVSVAFFGDGAVNEGVFHESLNLAVLWRLPVVFLCENNDRSQAATATATIAAHSIQGLAAAYVLPTQAVDGGDVGAVYHAVNEAVERGRRGEGPTFIEARTYPWPGHVSPWPRMVTGETDPFRRSAADGEYADWFAADPILRYTKELLLAGAATEGQLRQTDSQIQAEVQQAVERALASPFPAPGEAMEDVYA